MEVDINLDVMEVELLLDHVESMRCNTNSKAEGVVLWKIYNSLWCKLVKAKADLHKLLSDK